MNASLSKKDFDELRAEGHLVIDQSNQKVGVVASDAGDVLVFIEDDGDRLCIGIDPKHIHALCKKLISQFPQAVANGNSLISEYAAHELIAKVSSK